MSLCTNNKFTLTKNVDNDFIFTIKENGKTTPMVIDAGDTFSIKLVLLEDNSTIVDFTPDFTVYDALNGKLRLYITSGEVNALTSLRGAQADNYYLRPVYSLIIEANTLINGVFVAKIGKVYVG